ncbi:MAG: hypothetical protein ACI4JE_03905 [Ruminococcus sp.]
MKIKTGSIVKASAGRDCGGYFVVTGTDNGFFLIADGKSRRLAKPKRKNPKHLAFTNSVIDLNDITDKKLRRILREIGEAERQEVI